MLTACGSSDEPQVAQGCDGALSSEAVDAAESVLGTKSFQWDGSGLERTVTALIDDQAVPGHAPGTSPMCQIGTAADDRLGLRIAFRLYDSGDLYDDGTEWTSRGRYLYGMGREASTDNESADLFVGCSSPRMKGSEERPAPLQAVLRYEKTLQGSYPENTPATREAFLTILHSVTLTVVRELGCEGDAGLTETPVFTTKAWRGKQEG
ncbi:hypothetical protein ACFW2Y_02085 [Streptomyces sp. NPDC058877]|uniref:hypothetical protein n=1 Tax=Streptomyces sp. NPDC058877 TaxID=3346665 RepID=UPI00368CA8F5